MHSTTKLAAAVALTGLTIVATPAYSFVPAQECGSEHPQYKLLSKAISDTKTSDIQDRDNQYYDLQTISIDDATIKMVRDFTSRLDGRWHGTGLDIRCIVADDNTHTTINNYDVDAEIDKNFLGALIMQVQQENAEQVKFDTIPLSPKTELDASLATELNDNSLGQRTGHRSYTIDVSAPDTLVFDEKYRRFIANTRRYDLSGNALAPFALNLVHEIKTVSISAADLTVSRDVYINGKFISQQQWQLERL